jgi:uncharacterized protein YeaO (DUF488 family)
VSINIRRVYEPPRSEDGYRVLIDRIWPRGVRKDEAQVDQWSRELAVSTALRRWFGHDPTKWEEFRKRYRAELLVPEHRAALDELAQQAQQGPVTIVYGARDEMHNNAVVLAELLRERAAAA